MAAGQGWPQATCEALDRLTAVCYSCIPCYEVTFVKGAEKFSQQLNKSSSFNPDSTWKEL